MVRLASVEKDKLFLYNGDLYSRDLDGKDGSGKLACIKLVDPPEKTMLSGKLEVDIRGSEIDGVLWPTEVRGLSSNPVIIDEEFPLDILPEGKPIKHEPYEPPTSSGIMFDATHPPEDFKDNHLQPPNKDGKPYSGVEGSEKSSRKKGRDRRGKK